jgi:hypothetical protein
MLVALTAGLGVAVGIAGPVQAASQAPVWGQITQVALPTGANGSNAPASPDPRVDVTSISCWSAGNCAAVGTYVVQGTPSNFVAALLLMELNHVWQPSVEGIDPGVGQFELPSVSCVTGGACVAAGSYRNNNANDIVPDVFTATGGVWNKTGAALQLPSDSVSSPASQQISHLSSVSCALAGSCVAVGWYIAKPAATLQSEGVMFQMSGGTWGTATQITPPSNSATAQDTEPSSVSCAPSGPCAAVGTYALANSATGSNRFALSGSGGALSATASVQLPQPGDASSQIDYSDTPKVACGAAGCAATEPYFRTGRSGTTYALLSRSAGGGWTWAGALTGPAPYTGSTSIGQLGPLSCSAVGCTAAGVSAVNNDGSGGNTAAGWDGTGGAFPTTGQAIDTPVGPPTGSLDPEVLSCSSPGNCSTAGELTTTGGRYYGWAASEVDGIWQPAVNLQTAFTQPNGESPLFGGLSCSDAGDCSGVGYYYDTDGSQQGFVVDATGSGTTTTPSTSTTTPTTTTPGATPGHASAAKPHVSGLSVSVAVTCTGTGPCSVSLTLSATATLVGNKIIAITAAKRKRKVMALGRASTTIAAGKTSTVTVSLNTAGRKLLAKHTVLPASLTIKQGTRSVAATRVTFKRTKKH